MSKIVCAHCGLSYDPTLERHTHEHERDHDHTHGEHTHSHGHSHAAGGSCSLAGDDCDCGHDHESSVTAPYATQLAVGGAALMLAAFLPVMGTAAPWLMAAGTLLFGYPLFWSGARGLVRFFAFDELTLLTVAVVASLGLAAMSADPFEGVLEAAAVTVLFRLGNYLEARAISKSRRDIEALTKIRPDTATLVQPDGGQQVVEAAGVAVGATILLKAGDRVPIDCEVLSGGGYVDLSAITGESIPVQAAQGTVLPSGAINLDGLMTCRTTVGFEDSTASRIIRMVRDSAEQKGDAERMISRFAKVYTPIVMALATALTLVPPLLGMGSFSMWLSRALVFLVASCPCALVISVPLTFFAGVGAASRAGVLVKGTKFIETIAQADCVVFDKTGTLTQGVPMVDQLLINDGFEREELLSLAAAAERNSNHPTARAVLQYAGNVALPEVSGLTEHPGKGISLTAGGREVLCGSARLLTERGVDLGALPEANIYLAVNGRAAGCFLLADRARPEAAEAVAELRRMGVKTIAMLTGDGQRAARQVADELKLDRVDAQLLPQDKAEHIRRYKAEHRATLFVGDGINDAPVLAAADAGVAMGMGTDSAIEAADVVLMREKLTALPAALSISRRTMRKARQNIGFALAVKAAVLVLGALGMATMWMAVFADVGVSILAVLNAVTLLGIKNNTK